MKKLSKNAATTLIFSNKGGFFDDFESIKINTATATFSSKMYSELVKRGLKINAATFNLIDVTGDPIDIGDATLDGLTDYSGKFIVGGTLIITNKNALNGVTGVYAKKIIAPADMKLDIELTGVLTSYPAGATLELGKGVVLDDSYISRLDNAALVWTLGNVTALDDAVVEKMAEKDITVHCDKLLINEKAEILHGKRFQANIRDIVPDGCEYIEESLTLSAANAELYSEMLYITGSFTLKADATQLLGRFRNIVVCGNAHIPLDAQSVWKEIGTAKKVIPYRGELWTINGHETITHAQLEAAKADGISYTIRSNGKLDIDADVLKDDLDCILAVYYSGTVSLPAALLPAFKSKVVEGNGVMMQHGAHLNDDDDDEYEDDDMNADDDTQKINTATFVLI